MLEEFVSVNLFVNKIKESYDVDELKKQLSNVYFIIGTAYAGKSTMIKMLSEKYKGIQCEENWGLNYLEKYNVNPVEYPNLCYTKTHTMVEFVNRTPDEYYKWLRGSEMEITPIEINELIKIANNNPDKPIFVDTSIPMEVLKEISDYDHVIVMLSDQSLSVNKFFERPDFEKQIIFRAIKKSKNPEETMVNYKKVLEKANSEERYNYFVNSGFFVFKRDDSLSLDETLEVLAKQFKLNKENKIAGLI